MAVASFTRWSFLALAILATSLASPVVAQDVQWQAHTSFRQASDVAVSEEALWVATRGGIFRYDPASGERVGYSVSDGLHGTDVRALALDAANRAVWLGYSDGVFDRVDIESGRVRTFYDIQRNDRYPSRAINRLVTYGDSLLIATDFGVVVFDQRSDRLEVRDTYAQLGSTATVGIPVQDVLKFDDGDRTFIAAATDDGVSLADMASPNLQDPSAWTQIETAGEALSLASFRGRLYVGTETTLSTLTLDGTLATISGMNDVRRLVVDGPALIGINRFAAFEVSSDGAVRRFGIDGYSAPRSLAIGPQGRVWIADAEGGLLGLPDPLPTSSTVTAEVTDAYPQGPYHGTFSRMVVDSQGNLWAGSIDEAGTGIYRLDGDGVWTSFISRERPELQGRSGYRDVAVDPSGGVWGGSWGNAVVHIGPNEEIEVYDETNSQLRGISTNPSYVVVGGVATDAAGTLWATNMFTNERLVARTAEGEWIAASPRCDGFSPAGHTLEGIFVDSYGNKWFTVISEANQRIRRGLLAFDSGTSIDSGEDDQCRFFNAEGGVGQGLPAIGVHAVAEDRDGRIWIGTDAGPAFTQNSRLLPQSTGPVFIWPQPADRSQGNFLLFGVAIRDIVVDPANRIWFATDNGAYVIEETTSGGFAIVHHFTADNSPLLSNAVVSLAVDGRTGRIFLNTDRGLISYRSGSLEPASVAGDLFIYPNPVRIEDGVAPTINIRGLVEATELRIVTAAGDLIAEMSTRGGQVSWDGRDRSGRLVASGMYLLIAVGENGEGRGIGKVAVIR